MKNKRIFAVFNANEHHIYSRITGLFLCSEACCTLQIWLIFRYRLLSLCRLDYSVIKCVRWRERRQQSSFLYNLILTAQCQRTQVSGPLKSTVSAILRQQRDSLHRIRNSRSRECQIRGTRISSGSPSASSSSSIMRSTSASSISTGRRSVFRSSLPPPE